MNPVRTKADMYAQLKRGEFGNTIPQFLDVRELEASPDSKRFTMWGVRSAVHSMHPACRLYCPREEVADYARHHFADGVNISTMVDAVSTVLAWLEVWDSPTGLVVEGIQYPRTWDGWNWRNSMRETSRRKAWSGIAARHVLARHLNMNSADDLAILLREYPDHVIELSALDRCFGTVPHRNAVVWEVRAY